jgi:hypothetical protein
MNSNRDTSNPMVGNPKPGSAPRWNRWRIARWSAPALLLLVPLVAMQFSPEWNWTPFDFVALGVILYGAVLTYELVARRAVPTAYRAAVGVAVGTGVLLLWVNGAVGIIGDGPVNLLYFGVPAIGIIGAFVAGLEPRGMARTLFVMALGQMLVPVLALVIWNPPFAPGVLPVFVLNGIFAGLWLTSAELFRRAASPAQTASPA